MSVVQAGLAFRAARPIDDFSALLSRIYADDVEELTQPTRDAFDPRRPGDVMVQTFHDACFVCNSDLGLRALGGGTVQTSELHVALGRPTTILAFCHDDVRARYGYSLVSRGRLVRRRMQKKSHSGTSAVEATGTTEVSELGSPQPFERRWLSAAHFMEAPDSPADAPRRMYYLGDREILVAEPELTARLLHDGLEALFGVCPWDTLITPTYRFYRVAGGYARDGEGGTPQPLRGARARLPWWRRVLR